MSLAGLIRKYSSEAISSIYNITLDADAITVNATKPEFEGDYTVVLFSIIKQLRTAPDSAGKAIGAYLTEKHADVFSGFNVIKGFLNLEIENKFWIGFLEENYLSKTPGQMAANGQSVMVEYSSPNTNKPLHLGHLRNNFLGWSVAEILKSAGYKVVKTCISNDRGIHICKSMVAWQLFANGATPASAGVKGDHFVGDYYVMFGAEHKKQIAELEAQGMNKEDAERNAPIMRAAQQMLQDWEAGKPAVVDLWKTMNSWVYEGFAITYKRIGSDFDKMYYESDTYLLGKSLVQYGLDKKVFYQKDDGSVWIDLTNEGLDEKIVQRKDGTAVYITQDIGLAQQKQEQFHCNKSIYVVGNEQDYHFNVLKKICQKLDIPGADGIYHLSYGMVELPTGKMKTREGTVVDADDIVDEMIAEAKRKTEELGKTEEFSETERNDLYNLIGLGALKFFLLRVDPKKRMLFNPEESIDLHGFTAPFIQYTHARIKSILRKVQHVSLSGSHDVLNISALEKQVLQQAEQYKNIIEEAAATYEPSHIVNYVFNLAKTFNSFYKDHSIANAETEDQKVFRIKLAMLVASTIQHAMHLLGIQVPERM